MAKVIGCIGCGNMGAAILKGFAAKLDESEWRLCGYNRSPEKLLALKEKGIEAMTGIAELVEESEIII
ncbi:MAG: NAD(P)-binding domain-containing protein, partial [Desulfovibrio sp.]|nr:NAD(P)-binding domain-containing protein [Desulfovibrio sp.]